MRSRASGGICGDSSAAASARDHVELAPARDLRAAGEVDGAQLDRRPRQRAHDGAARRPGRPAAAATRAGRAPRRAGRRPPRRRAGAARRAPPARPRPPGPRARPSARARAIRSGAHALAADRRSTSAATLCACARSFAAAPEGDLAGPAGLCRAELLLEPVLERRDDGVGRVEHALRAAEAVLQSHDRDGPARGSGESAWKSRRFFAAAARKRSIAWSSSPAATRLPCSAASSRSSSPCAKFGSCTSSTSTWR